MGKKFPPPNSLTYSFDSSISYNYFSGIIKEAKIVNTKKKTSINSNINIHLHIYYKLKSQPFNLP